MSSMPCNVFANFLFQFCKEIFLYFSFQIFVSAISIPAFESHEAPLPNLPSYNQIFESVWLQKKFNTFVMHSIYLTVKGFEVDVLVYSQSEYFLICGCVITMFTSGQVYTNSKSTFENRFDPPCLYTDPGQSCVSRSQSVDKYT